MKHKWLHMIGDGLSGHGVNPSLCDICGLVVDDIKPAKLSDNGCPNVKIMKGSFLDRIDELPKVSLWPTASSGESREMYYAKIAIKELKEAIKMEDESFDEFFIRVIDIVRRFEGEILDEES